MYGICTIYCVHALCACIVCMNECTYRAVDIYGFAILLREIWTSETQAIEGVNSYEGLVDAVKVHMYAYMDCIVFDPLQYSSSHVFICICMYVLLRVY